MPNALRLALVVPTCGLLLTGCEQLGLELPAQVAAAREAEGRAVGSACRHSGRALEDCYTLNPKAVKAAVFAGWRDMDAYMRENNLEIVPSVVPKPEPKKKKKVTEGEGDEKTKEGDHSAKEEPAPAKQATPPGTPSAPKPSTGGAPKHGTLIPSAPVKKA